MAVPHKGNNVKILLCINRLNHRGYDKEIAST
jgi:hypothetical protein